MSFQLSLLSLQLSFLFLLLFLSLKLSFHLYLLSLLFFMPLQLSFLSLLSLLFLFLLSLQLSLQLSMQLSMQLVRSSCCLYCSFVRGTSKNGSERPFLRKERLSNAQGRGLYETNADHAHRAWSAEDVE